MEEPVTNDPVLVVDTGNGITYSSVTPPDGAPRHEKGSITLAA